MLTLREFFLILNKEYIKGNEMLKKFKGIKLKWYHFFVFWLPGGMFWLTLLLAYQYQKTELI